MPNELQFAEVVTLICKEDPRYQRDAYQFLRLGLEFTVRELRKKAPDRMKQSGHVAGPELLAGLRDYALDQFGPMAKTVLNAWGVERCSDFGEMVFNLIDYNVFSKNENDTREDFANLYDFGDAFVRPFLPSRPRIPNGTDDDPLSDPI